MDTLLVISDEPALAHALKDELPGHVIIAARPAEAAAKATKDVSLIVTEKDSAGSIASLEMNIAHLVITRPVRLRELLYTIEERLQAQTRTASEEIALAGGYNFSPRERVLVSTDGATRIPLTEKEGELFAALLAGGEEIISREQLLKLVWGYNEDIDTHTLETHIYRLRGKLRQIEAGYDIVSPDEGGYRLKIP